MKPANPSVWGGVRYRCFIDISWNDLAHGAAMLSLHSFIHSFTNTVRHCAGHCVFSEWETCPCAGTCIPVLCGGVSPAE